MAAAMVFRQPPIDAAASTPNNSFLSKFFSMLSPKKKMIAAAKPTHLQVPQVVNMARILSRFDEDGDGKISPAELRSCMIALGEDLSAEEAVAAVEFVDTDGDGMLGLEDFMKLAGGEEEDEKWRNLKEAFRVYELEGEGCITPRSLREALGRLGERRTIEDCEVMIRRFDVDRDGVLSFDEFKMMMV